MSLLTLDTVSARYGASQALFGVSFALAEGEALALMGRNGMGKTTTVRAICRMVATGGTLSFAGHDLTRLKPHRAARLGIGLVPEGRRCFAGLTVDENLRAAARPGPWDSAAVAQLFPRLAERRQQVARSLSGGEQQMLAIARALMTNPRLLILDEATEGLAPLIRPESWGAIRRLTAESGMALLVIDKSPAELSSVCDRAVVLERGNVAWQGRFGEMTGPVKQRFLGI